MQEMIKGGLTIEQIRLDMPIPHFRGRLRNAFYAFGRKDVELAAFEDMIGEEGGVVAAFCRAIRVSDAVALQISSSVPVMNASMSLLATYVLEGINRQRNIIVDGQRNPLRNMNKQDYLARLEGDRFDLSSSSTVNYPQAVDLAC
ncbi:hypothetical protein NKI38_25845 [Mesorhizobium sp. M0621]|uniref:hypothetical protein n=1 Tax=Mesorhizobium sp. M0621 TaxID=2956974 RepID=UPI00333BCC9D